MKLKKVMSSIAACALSVTMVAPSVFAAESTAKIVETAHGNMKISEDTVDPAATGSITLYKLLENDGHTYEADGQFDESADATEKVPNVLFTRVKIATLENVGGTVEGSGDATGFYYSLTDAFKAEATALGVNTEDYDTVVKVGGTDVKNTYFSSEQVEDILDAMKTSKQAIYTTTNDNDVAQTWSDATAASATGETAINAWVDANGTDFAVTDLNGRTSADGLELGLYLIAETGYVDMNGNVAKTTYRSRTYDENGVMTGTTDTVKPTQQNISDYDAQNVANPGTAPNQNQIAAQYDRNYNDNLDKDTATSDGNQIANVPEQAPTHVSTAGDTVYTDGSAVDASQYNQNVAEIGTENPYVIENPCSPFLASVPMTNVSAITETSGTVYPAGSVWQYDVTVYPKNAATTIYKKVIADDGNTLDGEQDINIGQSFEQVIYADAPATMFNHQYQQFEIKDTMSTGMTLQKVARVAFGPKLVSPAALNDFQAFHDMVIGEDYNVYTVDASGAETLDADGIIPAGDSDNIRSFIVKMTPQGLAKLSDTPLSGQDTITYENVVGAKQVIVVFDAVLNENAVIGAATQNGKLQFNVNTPSLTWRHENTATRTIEGNEVKLYTYEIDLTKIGKDITEALDDTSDTQEMRDDHSFDASKTAFTIMQNRRIDPTYKIENSKWTTGVITTEAAKDSENAAAYLTFVKEADGVYHVYSPTDGAVKEIVRYNQKSAEGTDGNATYAATAAKAEDGFTVDATNGITVYQIVQPAASAADATKDASGNEGGLLVIKGLDSETYTFTELSTSKSFNLLSATFDVDLNAPEIKDGNLVANNDATQTYGASLTTNDVTTGLTHHRGIVTMSVNNYKTITLHTGGTGMVMIYTAAVLALLAAAGTAMYIKRRSVA